MKYNINTHITSQRKNECISISLYRILTKILKNYFKKLHFFRQHLHHTKIKTRQQHDQIKVHQLKHIQIQYHKNREPVIYSKKSFFINQL